MKSKPVRAVAGFVCDSLPLHCHNGMIEKYWREDRVRSSHYRQALGPLTKERISKHKWNKNALASFGFE